jgi:hypothetical protein
MTPANDTSPSLGLVAPFLPIASLLRASSPEKLDEARRRVAMLDREDLTAKFREVFLSSKRGAAFVLAQELVSRDIAPAFWYADIEIQSHDTNQKFDAFIYDLLHLRRRHYFHVKKVRYQRCKNMLTGSETAFHREAEYAYYQGRRPVWKLECHLLRSAPIAKRHAVIGKQSKAVFSALANDLDLVRRTAVFGDAEAEVSLSRRHTLWKCRQMTRGSPSEIARLYEQITGEEIGRQVVAKQLKKVEAVLRNIEMT